MDNFSVTKNNYFNPSLVDAIIPKFGSLLLLITTLAYYTGWRSYSAYFETLGAPWILSSIPNSDFLFESSGIIFNVFVAAFFSILFIVQKYVKINTLAWISFGLSVAGMMLLHVDFLLSGWLNQETVESFNDYSSMFLASSAGAMLGHLCLQIYQPGKKFTPNFAHSTYAVLSICFYTLPVQLGTNKALQDLRPSSLTLPLVEVTTTATGGKKPWRLMQVFGTTALLISQPGTGTERKFRLVQTQDLMTIYIAKRTKVL